MTEPIFSTRVVAIERAAEDILSFWLEPMSVDLPMEIDPGSHVDVQLPNGMMRSYSLSNGLDAGKGYRLTVARDVNSRGGSICMHDGVKLGDVIEVSRPRNNFSLDEQAQRSVFIAGGIGITPFLPMMTRLNQIGKPWRMVYCMRNRGKAALLDEIERLAGSGSGELVAHFDDQDGVFDLDGLISSLSSGDHVYCCGPGGMLDAFRASTQRAGVAADHVHFEYFIAESVLKPQGNSFQVVLHKSGREFTVGPGQTILQTLLDQGVNVPFSCEQGVCGACETKVIEGTPDHHDMILNDEEKLKGKTMMICCSRARSDRLVLDI